MVALIDHTDTDLAALIQADLGSSTAQTNVSRQLIDWFHYRARRIACRPRQVTMSEPLRADISSYPALSQIAEDFRSGAEMSPWLSDKVRSFKANHRADMMFNYWQISHFHLGSHFVAPDKIKRTGPLLFGYVDNNEAVLLKVATHGAWSDEGILAELLRTRSSLMTQWELNGGLPVASRFTAEERGALRRKGLNVETVIDGRSFMPGLGTAASGHAVRLTRKADRFLLALSNVRDAIRNNSTPRETRSRLSFPIGMPVQLRIRIEPNGDLTVYDGMRSWSFFVMTAPA